MTDDLKTRLAGLLILLGGVFIAWIGIWLPLHAAQTGAAMVSWPLRAVVLVPMAVIFGLFLLVAGTRYPYRNVEQKTLTPIGWAVFGVAGVVALVGFFWMKSALAALGYS